MSKLIEAVLKVPTDDAYSLGWQPCRREKLSYLFAKVPVECVEFKDVVGSCLVLDTVRQELKELGYRDEEFIGGDSFIRVQLTNGDVKFTLFANKDGGSLYNVEVTFEKGTDHFEEGFFDRNIGEYYRLLTYFSSKFIKLRSILLCIHPTYIAQRDDDSGKWTHKLQMTDRLYVPSQVANG